MSLVISNKNSHHTQKRVTRSQSALNNSVMSNNKTNLDNEKEIIKQTYGNNNISEQSNNTPSQQDNTPPEITPVIKNTIPINDRDIVIANTEVYEITSSSSPKLFLPVTTPHVILDDLIHASNKGKSVDRSSNNTNQLTQNDFTTLYTMPTPNDQQQTANNTPINIDFYDANKIITLSDMENIELINETNVYFSFALLTDF
ncbi:hypothetical protein C1645_851664 [Glomus cerebriforme]|uniref:Uncharacterized protein n=1 Tax=Glomus cerebriforme TaxID=658196 RepID=A0A397SVS9_9GLOM|nr:hypothetical protein C1645_851664 [Glomus cerebriforme]